MEENNMAYIIIYVKVLFISLEASCIVLNLFYCHATAFVSRFGNNGRWFS